MTDAMPDRLSTDPDSKYYDRALLERGVGIKFNGQEKTNVEEYCVSEGWVRLAVGRTVDRHGRPMTIKYKGKVEPYLNAPAEAPAEDVPPENASKDEPSA
ncbi:MAG TPA: DUF3297 family protein [Rhizomicrobium sp.]|jgi:hypothetical protein|nr:DUF3297 family protein [Rhizomicrobium sp.]